MRYRIIADSSCDLPSDFLEKDDIDFSIVPLTITVDSKDFIDDDSLDIKALLDVMRTGKSMGTACPSPSAFAEEMKKNTHSICVTISRNLSGTYNAALQGAEIAKEENPELKAELADSFLTAGGMVLMIMRLREWIKEGLPYDEIVEKVRAYQKTICARFVLQDLSNLVKAGRMSKVAGVFASALSLCPVCGDNGNGQIVVLEKVRGAKQALSHLVDTVAEKVKSVGKFPVVISHVDNEEQANLIKNMLFERYGLDDVMILPARGLVAYYAAAKGIVMCF